MESSLKELVYNASAQLFADKVINTFTKNLPEQLYVEGEWDVDISEITFSTM